MAVYEIAFHLKMSVGRLCDEMTYEELKGWENYFERRPVGWRDDSRTHKLLQAQGVKVKAADLFPSIAAVEKSIERVNEDGMNMASIAGSQMFMQMLKAKGGETLEL